MRGRHDVALEHVTQFPAGHQVGHGAIFFHRANHYFGDQFTIAADEHFTLLNGSLFFTHIKHHKVPFWIHQYDGTLQVGGKLDKLLVRVAFLRFQRSRSPVTAAMAFLASR